MKLWLVIWILFAGCSMMPTKVKRTMDQSGLFFSAVESYVEVNDAILIDARDPFSASTQPLPNAIHINVSDYIAEGSAIQGRALTRKLSLGGVSEWSRIIVAFATPEELLQAARLSWVLSFLGYDEVSVYPIERLKLPRFTMGSELEPRASVAQRDMERDPSWMASKAELLKIIRKPRTSGAPQIIDVRSERDYLRSQKYPDIGSINIPWTRFVEAFDDNGKKLSQEMQEVGLQLSDVLYVVDEDGIRAAAATALLRQWGFERVRNFKEGLQSL